MRIAALYHASFEKTGSIEDWIIDKEHSFTEFHLYDSPLLPMPEEFDLLVIMGGPMSVNDIDVHPWIAKEIELAGISISAGKAVIGICLGAQIVASVLGSRVFKNIHKEIGWFPIEFNRERKVMSLFPQLPEKVMVFHWHGETFELPAGAVALASSAITPCQGFLFSDRVLALQFHPEVKPENISLMINHEENELVTDSFIQDAETISAGLQHIPEARKLMEQFLDYFDRLIKPDEGHGIH